MLIDFNALNEVTIPHLNGGQGAVSAKMFMGENGKVMISRLPKGASIGPHEHPSSSEIDYVLSGVGRAECGGVSEELSEGRCHYCPKGSAHSILNTGDSDLILLTVVPEY